MEYELFPELRIDSDRFNTNAILTATQKTAILLSYVSGTGLRRNVHVSTDSSPASNERLSNPSRRERFHLPQIF